MTKLETLYASIKGLEKVGLTLTDEMLKKADELEEQLIKNLDSVCKLRKYN